jgi:hypothetical protein
MRSIVALVLVLVAVAGIGYAFIVVARPMYEVASSVDPDVTYRCEGISTAERCELSGDVVLDQLGAPSETFEMEDVTRLEITEPPFGERICTVAYFIQRYPDDAAWELEIECPGP